MMRTVCLSAIIACATLITAIPVASAHNCAEVPGAACRWTEEGVSWPDSDCDHVYDHDALCLERDNCPNSPNGDCDASPLNCDVDGDRLVDERERAAGNQANWDNDRWGDACDDSDSDGVLDYLDNCKTVANPDQDPTACTDSDGDFFEDPIDNCPDRYNLRQDDADLDGVGDACDSCPDDPNPRDVNGDQDDSICAAIEPEPIDPADPGESTPLEPTAPEPRESSQYKQGTGGCALAAASPMGFPWQGILLLATGLVIGLHRRR